MRIIVESFRARSGCPIYQFMDDFYIVCPEGTEDNIVDIVTDVLRQFKFEPNTEKTMIYDVETFQ